MILRLRASRAEVALRAHDLDVAQQESARQRTEAMKLLGVAKVTGEALRKSRSRNHYGFVLDDIFNGRRRA